MGEGREIAQSGGQDAGYVREAFSKIADRYVVTNHVLSVGTVSYTHLTLPTIYSV